MLRWSSILLRFSLIGDSLRGSLHRVLIRIDAFWAEIDIGPAGKPILAVPLTLAVSHEIEKSESTQQSESWISICIEPLYLFNYLYINISI